MSYIAKLRCILYLLSRYVSKFILFPNVIFADIVSAGKGSGMNRGGAMPLQGLRNLIFLFLISDDVKEMIKFVLSVINYNDVKYRIFCGIKRSGI